MSTVWLSSPARAPLPLPPVYISQTSSISRKAGANREQTRTPGKGRSRDDLNQEVREPKGQAQKYLPHGREGETEGMNEMPWGAPTTQKKISEGTTILGDTLPEEEREGVRKRLRST